MAGHGCTWLYMFIYWKCWNKGKTEFSNFALALTPFFIGAMKPEEFSKELFMNIYLSSTDDDNPVDETLPRTFKSYYYGDTDISTLAKKICGSLDRVGFAECLYLDADDSISNLCRVFRDECIGIDTHNYGASLANRFEEIITAAAKPKRKKASRPQVGQKRLMI